MIEVWVAQLAKRGEDIFVVLQERNGSRQLDFVVAPDDAWAIDGGRTGKRYPRPMTHDFIVDLLGSLGDVSVERVVITGMHGDVYLGEVHLRHGDASVIVDCRPSDGISLALRSNVPIFVDETRLADRVVAA